MVTKITDRKFNIEEHIFHVFFLQLIRGFSILQKLSVHLKKEFSKISLTFFSSLNIL
jgi:hypothetical protein